MNGTVSLDLDAWLPEPQVRTIHRREARATPQELWTAAATVELDEARALGRLVRWRIPGTPAESTYRAMLSSEPFTVLAEGDTWSISGLVGRIWTLRRDYPRIDGADAFRAWDEPGTARVVFCHFTEPVDGSHSAIVSEARVAATDHAAARRLAALWTVVGPFERFIGGEALTLAARRAEERAGRFHVRGRRAARRPRTASSHADER